MVNDKYLS